MGIKSETRFNSMVELVLTYCNVWSWSWW